ncbi:MAG: aminopeptidase N [Pseudohongiellaceae bacterium]
MRDAQARTTYLKNYRPPEFLIETTELHFDLHEDHATVRSRLLFKRNPAAGNQSTDSLVLHGQNLVLQFLALDGRTLTQSDFLVDDETLTIPHLSRQLGHKADRFELRCHTRLEPQNNTTLEGLFKSGRMFCTQCEAEGFRCITYYLDRPDVMSKFVTTIVADRKKYPVLLSNGNLVDSGEVEDDPARHWVTWRDPFKKPSYLFALVAGDLVSLDDSFVTQGEREVSLRIFVEEKDLDKCDHAMASLKRAMRWDEEKFGREYDLDIFMIVAVDDFNMGAMENKGLNIFNTSCVLANPHTTTDLAFRRVEAVVAHEYFHNWSGNRVTCRDWFQLSLKEGFTVFRDSEFSADMGSRTVKRVEEVNLLKTVQFAEDAGPLAHSVRPDSYMEIANFYTVTIYEKGAEVVRMISLLLGEEKFRAGCDLYFKRHDGQAVTTEEFVKAMEDASDYDLSQFRRWYTQAGTPVLDIEGEFDESAATYTLHVRQHCPASPGQSAKQPVVIPLRLGLLGRDGRELPLLLEGDYEERLDRVLAVTEAEQHFVFTGIREAPVPSLLRSFSAPVRLNFAYSREELYFLMVHDSDGFNRWNASQLLACDIMDEMLRARDEGGSAAVPAILRDAWGGILAAVPKDPSLDKAMVAHLLNPPTESFLIERADVADVEGIHAVREALLDHLGGEHKAAFAACYEANSSDGEFRVDAGAMAERALKNLALYYLVRSGDAAWVERCYKQCRGATNMTDQLTALRYLVHSNAEAAAALREQALGEFYAQWRHEALVVDQWFMVQATAPLPDTLERVRELLSHPDFTLRNPNKVRSLIGAFCGQNHVGFHHRDGSGYEFLADQALALDKLNPQIAARLLTPLTRWRKFDNDRQRQMQVQLQRVKASPELSRDMFEVVEKSTV